MSRAAIGQRGFGFAGILIIAGAMLLLNAFEVLPDGYWWALAPLWPALFIALGANILVSRVSVPLGSAAGLLVLVGTLGVAWFRTEPGSPLPERVMPLQVALDGARSAEVTLTLAAGRVRVTSGAPAGTLADGQVRFGGNDEPSVDVRDSGGVRQVKLSSRGRDCGPGCWTRRTGEEWDVRLSTAVPIDIRVDSGAASLDLDLRELHITKFSFNTGASSTAVAMPRPQGNVESEFNIGAASLELTIPEGVEARIKVESGLSAVHVPEDRFIRTGSSKQVPGLFTDSEYSTPGFDGAADRLDIRIAGGASSVVIK